VREVGAHLQVTRIVLRVPPPQLSSIISTPGEEKALSGDREHVIPADKDVSNADISRQIRLSRKLEFLRQGAIVFEVGERLRAERCHPPPLTQLAERVGSKGPDVAFDIEEDGEAEARTDVYNLDAIETIIGRVTRAPNPLWHVAKAITTRTPAVRRSGRRFTGYWSNAASLHGVLVKT